MPISFNQPASYNHPEQMSLVILELLNLTRGTDFAVISNEVSHPATGILRRHPSQKESIITPYARIQSFTEQQFLTDLAVKQIIFNAFFSGQLGVRDEHKHYAFNKERYKEFKQAGIRDVVVINAPDGEHIEKDALSETGIISDEIYQMLLLMLEKINPKSKSANDESPNAHLSLSHVKAPTARTNLKPEKAPLIASKTSQKTNQQHSEEAINEGARSESRKRKHHAEEKDDLADKKRRKIMKSEQKKKETKHSAQKQSTLLHDLVAAQKLDEEMIFKLIQIAEHDEELFLQLIKSAGLNKTKILERIKLVNEELHRKLISNKE